MNYTLPTRVCIICVLTTAPNLTAMQNGSSWIRPEDKRTALIAACVATATWAGISLVQSAVNHFRTKPLPKQIAQQTIDVTTLDARLKMLEATQKKTADSLTEFIKNQQNLNDIHIACLDIMSQKIEASETMPKTELPITHKGTDNVEENNRSSLHLSLVPAPCGNAIIRCMATSRR